MSAYQPDTPLDAVALPWETIECDGIAYTLRAVVYDTPRAA